MHRQQRCRRLLQCLRGSCPQPGLSAAPDRRHRQFRPRVLRVAGEIRRSRLSGGSQAAAAAAGVQHGSFRSGVQRQRDAVLRSPFRRLFLPCAEFAIRVGQRSRGYGRSVPLHLRRFGRRSLFAQRPEPRDRSDGRGRDTQALYRAPNRLPLSRRRRVQGLRSQALLPARGRAQGAHGDARQHGKRHHSVADTRPDMGTVSDIPSSDGGTGAAAAGATAPSAAVVPVSAKPVRVVGPTFFPAN